MKKLPQIGILVLIVIMVVIFGCKKKNQTVSPIVGHWGCEQYVSCRTDSLGVEEWDTSWFEAVAGGEYELFFNADGSGLLKLNNSPAFIKEFSCKYEYNSDNQLLTVESSAWLYALYGSLFMDENQATFKIESLTNSNLVASWTNYLAEPQPFFERFFIKRID
jgi:hypothetical protein